MRALLVKEINSFLNSLIGYIVIIVFLITISLFLWIFPGGDMNILDGGYATIEPLFAITPWVYLFLVPAVTMRMFSEEKKTGTIELLLTKPLTELQIVIAKYLSGVILVFISLLPTLVYYFTVYHYSVPMGNVDSGGTYGSYIGLLLLGAVFVSIGLFASALADNQVVAFIIALFLCLVSFKGFEALGSMTGQGQLNNLFATLSINAHYLSMSRGVIDTRDVIYFLSVIALFVMLSKIKLESRKW